VKLFVEHRLRNEEALRKVAVIQTYYYLKGIAPRVYDIGWLGQCPYMLIEYIDDKPLKEVNNKKKVEVKSIASESGFIEAYDIDINVIKNYMGNYYVDFQSFLIDFDVFWKWLKGRIREETHWGHLSDKGMRVPYHTYEVRGTRDINYRIKALGLDKIDFVKKSVLDIGCNLGLMSHYAAFRGAQEVTGVDVPSMFGVAELYKYYKGIKNVQLYGKELTPESIDQLGQFDIVFYFAMVHSLGYPKKLKDITKELLIFEGHNLQSEDVVRRELENIFKSVEFKGFTTDRGRRPVFWCYGTS